MHEAFKAVLADGNSERRRKLYSQVSRRALPSLGNLILNLAHNRDLLYPGCSAKAKTILRLSTRNPFAVATPNSMSLFVGGP